jgi:Fe-Mn family superoxide dismutase
MEVDMRAFSRRRFLLASSGALAGTFAVSGLAETDIGGDSSPGSGLVTGKPIPLRYDSLPGFLSAEQLSPHYAAHYGGALRGYINADTRLQNSVSSGPKIDPDAYGALQRARTSKGNSVLLHELYFEGLTARQSTPGRDVRKTIERRFGTLDKWAEDFQASARAAAGWAILAVHPLNGNLYNVISDEHAMGVLWMATPLLVIDVYEHAFYVDYQNRKTEYIEKFMNHIDWDQVSTRMKHAS